MSQKNDPKYGIQLIKKWEGLRLKAYTDSVGVWTIGWGTTVYPSGKKVKSGDIITEAQAEEYLMNDINTIRRPAIERLVKAPMDDYEFGAILSFIYNLGVGNFSSSTLLKKINALDFKGASKEFDKWVKAKGKVLQGLVNRRNEEESLWAKGEFLPGFQGENTSVADEAIEPISKIETLPKWLQVIYNFLNAIFFPVKKVVASEPNSLFDHIIKNSPNIGPKMTSQALPWLTDQRVTNKDYMVLVDMDLHDSRKRGYLVDLKTGTSDMFEVSHGSKSDPDKDGYATVFSNTPNSNMSSLGAMVTGQQYGKSVGGWSKFQYALKLIGLQPGLNDKVEQRAVVFHDANYVTDKENDHTGDSLGCLATSPSVAKRIINKIDGGCLVFVYHRSLDKKD